jgi:MFS transporter, YNFM family, putative membrane transport protein
MSASVQAVPVQSEFSDETSSPTDRDMGVKERLALMLIGFAAFLPLYAPQAVLPEIAATLQVSKASAGSIIGMTTLAVALAAPVAGPLTDRFGHKRSLLAALLALAPLTALLSLCTTLDQMLLVRFLQGLALPALFSGAVAYVSERWRGRTAASGLALYVAGSALGGFAGRFIAGGLWERAGWTGSFLALAATSAVCGGLVYAWLPRETDRHPGSLLAHFGAMRRHLKNFRILAACLLGAGALFSMTATLSYVGFHLAEPPFNFSPAGVGAIFLVYPLSAASTSLTGTMVERFGTSRAIRCAIGICLTGQAALLVPNPVAVTIGLGLFVAGIFLVQSMALGFVGRAGGQAKGAAVGLYVCCFYGGGSLGSILPGIAWRGYGWAGCVMLVATALAIGFLAAGSITEAQRQSARQKGTGEKYI